MKPIYIEPKKHESGNMQVYDEIKKHGGELIKLGNHEKKPKFKIGDTVETISKYETECCTAERENITEIDYNHGSVVYLIVDTWIYEKWLKKVE